MRKAEIKETNLPQLIVGLDSQNDDSNYIHIIDAKENVDYYCPCCKGLIKPRAYKKDEKYKMQPHFYHISGGCTEETYIHYICKNFLFKTGSKFVIEDIEYEVKDVVTEKGYSTKFGVYIPDITVVTTSDKIFYFEIRNTNKKTTDYVLKWDELGNDVVEVDVRQFVNQKFENDVPVFKLIYSDGICYIREYVRKEYSQIEQRKLEWKRQDKLNYKIKWERLDWFWRELQEYVLEKNQNLDLLLNSFENLDFEDMEFCLKIIHNHQFKQIEEKCIEINNKNFYQKLKELNVELIQFSPRKFYIKEYLTSNISRRYSILTTWTPITKGFRFLQLITSKLIVNDTIKNKIINNINNVDVQYKKYLDNMCINDNIIMFYGYTRHYINKTIDIKSFNISELDSDYEINKALKKYEEKCIEAEQDEREYKENQKKLYEEQKNQLIQNNEIVKKQRELYEPLVKEIVEKINNCKNHAWQCQYEWVDISSKFMGFWEYRKEIQFNIVFVDCDKSCLVLTFDDLNQDTIIKRITERMNYIVKHSGLTMYRKKRRCYIDSASSRVLFVRGE